MSSGFDSLIFRLGSFAKSAEKKTQELIEISQLKWKMAKLKSKIERKYTKILKTSFFECVFKNFLVYISTFHIF